MKEFVEKLIEKIKVTSLEIIVTGTKDKPYFEIKYKEVGKEDYKIGYSSYDLNTVFCWKEECFEIVNQLEEEMGVSKMENTTWIACSERLPEYTGEYNVTVVVASELGSFEDVTTLRFENIKGKEPRWVIPKDEIYRVIAWMELPEKYKEKNNGSS